MREKKQTNKDQDHWHSYDKTVGASGHYYHQQLILPKTLELLDLKKSKSARLLDLGCGQGILARHLPEHIEYVGLDASPALLKAARSYGKHPKHFFVKKDLAEPFSLDKKDFTHATILLALQNIAEPLQVLKNAAAHLCKGAKFLIVLNHPCFRIPRQSSWGIDAPKKIQYRRIDRYFSPLAIPIQMRPGDKQQPEETMSYHHPLSSYSKWLHEAGFTISLIEEWCSDKKSTGTAAAMENRARQEFPLFLALLVLRT